MPLNDLLPRLPFMFTKNIMIIFQLVLMKHTHFVCCISPTRHNSHCLLVLFAHKLILKLCNTLFVFNFICTRYFICLVYSIVIRIWFKQYGMHTSYRIQIFTAEFPSFQYQHHRVASHWVLHVTYDGVDRRWTFPTEHCISSKLIMTVFMSQLASYNTNQHYLARWQ